MNAHAISCKRLPARTALRSGATRGTSARCASGIVGIGWLADEFINPGALAFGTCHRTRLWLLPVKILKKHKSSFVSDCFDWIHSLHKQADRARAIGGGSSFRDERHFGTVLGITKKNDIVLGSFLRLISLCLICADSVAISCVFTREVACFVPNSMLTTLFSVIYVCLCVANVQNVQEQEFCITRPV
jgi:hypothetical protein